MALSLSAEGIGKLLNLGLTCLERGNGCLARSPAHAGLRLQETVREAQASSNSFMTRLGAENKPPRAFQSPDLTSRRWEGDTGAKVAAAVLLLEYST